MRLARVLAATGGLLWTWTAHACTVCDSATGKQLRAGLFNGHFAHTLLLVAAPMPVLVGAVFLLHATMPDLGEDLDVRAAEVGPTAELPGSELLA